MVKFGKVIFFRIIHLVNKAYSCHNFVLSVIAADMGQRFLICNPQNNSAFISPLFTRWWNWGTERLSNWPWVTQLISYIYGAIRFPNSSFSSFLAEKFSWTCHDLTKSLSDTHMWQKTNEKSIKNRSKWGKHFLFKGQPLWVEWGGRWWEEKPHSQAWQLVGSWEDPHTFFLSISCGHHFLLF